MSQHLEICSVCSRVRDEGTGWRDLWTYLGHRDITSSGIVLQPSYCPDCEESYRLLMTYGRADRVTQSQVA